MKIKEIFDEIAAIGSTNAKIEILKKYKDNELLKRVLYLANSKRVKFYIKQIPEYTKFSERTLHINSICNLEGSLETIEAISRREWTGHDAINELRGALTHIPDDDAYIIERIIEKDCKIGLGTTFINKVFPDLIEKTPYQGCIPFNIDKAKKLFEGGKTCISEVKADGRYVNVIIRGNEVEMESRQGEQSMINSCELIVELEQLPDCVLNGELVMKGTSRLISNGIIASIIDYQSKYNERSEKENEKKYNTFLKEKNMSIEEALSLIQLKVWDILEIEEYFSAKSTTKRIDRLNILKETIKDSEFINIIEHKLVNSYEEAMLHFTESLENGEEGTVLKSLDGGWKNGKPTYQIKLKMEMDLDLKIIGFNYGEKGSKNENVISSITCETSCGELSTRAQGLTEDIMKYVTENQDSLLGTIIEIKCNGLSKNSKGGNSVFYPRLNEFRTDKTEANSFEECIEIQNGVLGLK